MPRRDHIQLSDAELAAWVDTQRQDGESRGRCAGRLLWEYRALLAIADGAWLTIFGADGVPALRRGTMP